MARPREFDTDSALDGAIAVFREHGFEGSSAQMLVAAARRYGMGEYAAHFDALRSGARAIDGITAMLRRVVETADQPCLGVSSICEFGASRPDLKEINALLGASLRGAVAARVRDVQREGDVAAGLDPEAVAEFLIANIAGIRVAGRGGADRASLTSLADMALRALR